MKLKLEMQQEVAVLSVLESLTVQEVAVLKAGLNKLFQTGRKAVVVDLTHFSDNGFPLDVESELSLVPGWAATLECQVLFAIPTSVVGHAPDRDQAVQLMKSPTAKFLATEAMLSNQLRALQARKTQLEQVLAQGAERQHEFLSLKRENSQLKLSVETLESQLRALLKARRNPYKPSDLLRQKQDILLTTVGDILREKEMIPTPPRQ